METLIKLIKRAEVFYFNCRLCGEILTMAQFDYGLCEKCQEQPGPKYSAQDIELIRGLTKEYTLKEIGLILGGISYQAVSELLNRDYKRRNHDKSN